MTCGGTALLFVDNPLNMWTLFYEENQVPKSWNTGLVVTSLGIWSPIFWRFFVSPIRELIWHIFCLQKILLYQESVHVQIVIEQNVNSSDCLFMQLCTAVLRLIVRSWLDVPTFATRRLHACHHMRAPSSGRWNCGREMSGNFA